MEKIMTVRAPEALQKALADLAKQAGVGRSALVLQILWDFLAAQEAKRHDG